MKGDEALNSFDYSSLKKIIGKSASRKFFVFSTLRLLANGLDILGLAGIALLATAFGSLASGQSQALPIEFPLLGQLVIAEFEAMVIASVVAIVFVSKSGFSIFLNLRTSLFIAEIESKLSDILARDVFQISSLSEPNKTSVSDFQNIAMSSTSGIKTYLYARVLFYSEGSLLLSLLLVFLVVNPLATVLLTLFMGSILFVLNKIISVRLNRSGHQSFTGSRQSLEAARDLHGIHHEAQASGVIDKWLEKFSEGRAKMANSSAITLTLNGLPRFVIETSLILGIFLFIGGVIVFSDIASQSVTIGVFLAGGLRIMASIIPFQGAITGMRSGAATGLFALDALKKVVDKTDFYGKTESSVQPNSAKVIFDDVWFSYGKGSDEVLKGISFEIEPKTKVAIVGPSGAGKTTIFDLAMGFQRPSQGSVTVGDQASRNVLISSPGYFALVPQRPHLISGNILENVSLRSSGETDTQRVKEALIRAGLGELTASPNWQEREIQPDSGEFSGGEIQRLSLARALYGEPKILFLDEATSALDAETELEITNVLEVLKKDMSVVLIAHRLSTVKQADKIIYLDGGELIGEGTFEELKTQVPDFANAIQILGLGD